ncbi:MAG: thermonuclease family protein [Pseudomonadota bacterium]
MLVTVTGISPAMAETAATAPEHTAQATDGESAYFPICSGRNRVTCIVDGDTIWYRGTKIRIADIDTPETSRPGCAQEAATGHRATKRMQALLNQAAFTLEPSADGRDTDYFGRALRVITRDGLSLGEVLMEEGLAGVWGGNEVEWC